MIASLLLAFAGLFPASPCQPFCNQHEMGTLTYCHSDPVPYRTMTAHYSHVGTGIPSHEETQIIW